MARRISFPLWTIPAALLVVISAAYGFFAAQGGIHWDDWAFMWVPAFLGKPGLAQYFASSRPLWGDFYILNTSWIGTNIFGWQIFALSLALACSSGIMVGASSDVAEKITRCIFHNAVHCFISRLHGTFHRYYLWTFLTNFYFLFSFHCAHAFRRTPSALFLARDDRRSSLFSDQSLYT